MTLQQLRYVIQAADSRSMNEAAKALYISQPSLSGAIKELEKEIGIELFKRSSHGTVLTPEGEEFLGYARQVTDQYQLLENRYVYRTKGKKKFSVSMQHYSFAVKAFVELVKQFGMDEYEFAVYETRTYDVLMDVKNFKSELGILYRNDFNAKVLNKLMKDNNLEFHDLFSCGTYKDFYREPRKCFIYRRFRGFSLLRGKILVINGVISSAKGQVFPQPRFALTGTGARKC